MCGHDAQCKNKLCRVPPNATCGACSGLGTSGASCERDDDCDYGLECFEKKCLAKGKPSEGCGPAAPCRATLACSGGTCAPPLAAGAACTCKAPRGGARGTCEAAAADGAPCNDDTGPKCILPARCQNGVCTIGDPARCK